MHAQDVFSVEAAYSTREGAEEESGRSESVTVGEHSAHQSQQVLHGGGTECSKSATTCAKTARHLPDTPKAAILSLRVPISKPSGSCI